MLAKTISVDEAAGLVRSGMWLDYGACINAPETFDKCHAVFKSASRK